MPKAFINYPIVAKWVFFILIIFIATAYVNPYANPPVALLSGFLFTLIFGHPYFEKSRKLSGLILKSSIIGLGFGMTISQTIVTGASNIYLILIIAAFVLILGWLAGRLLRNNFNQTFLIASGTAICGGSAIAALAPVIKADPRDMSVALAVVFIFNAISLLLFPVLGYSLGLSPETFGLWAALAIHDTSSVVGAASVYGFESIKTATSVKLTRALFIIPFVFFTAIWMGAAKKGVSVPWFIVFFILAVMLNSFPWFPQSISEVILIIAQTGLTISIFLIGSCLTLEGMKQAGFRPFLLGLILWVFVSGLALLIIRY